MKNGPIAGSHFRKIGNFGDMPSVWHSMGPPAYIPPTSVLHWLHPSITNCFLDNPQKQFILLSPILKQNTKPS